jgi:putative DNA primase/helicase
MTAVTNISHLAHLDSPDVLRKGHAAWLVWRFEPNENPGGKPRKVPYYIAGGRRQGVQGSPEDRARLVTFDAARVAAARQGMDGVGYALLPGCGVVALDFDRCVTDGALHPKVRALLADTYAEYSPSGEGVRAFFAGELGNDKDPATPSSAWRSSAPRGS